MALVQVDFVSRCLHRNTTFLAIIPTDRTSAEGYVLEKKPFKTLYLLHGLWGNYRNWVSQTRIQQWAEDKNLAVIMPSGDNSFYLDNKKRTDMYGEFTGVEIVEQSRAMFPLSCKREDTYIGGLSMGGYGAVRTGLKYHQTFGRIVALSSAFIIHDDIPQGADGPEAEFPNRTYVEDVFGDLSKIIGSDMDYEYLIKLLKEQNMDIPKIFMACGTEDFLINQNRAYRDFLQSEGVDFEYHESKGVHDWYFWDEYIKKVMDWLPE